MPQIRFGSPKLGPSISAPFCFQTDHVRFIRNTPFSICSKYFELSRKNSRFWGISIWNFQIQMPSHDQIFLRMLLGHYHSPYWNHLQCGSHVTVHLATGLKWGWKLIKDEEIQIIRKELNDLSLEKPDMDSFNQLLNKEDSNLDTSLIMYAEQLARKDVEINSLRSKRKELEGRVRQGLGFSC